MSRVTLYAPADLQSFMVRTFCHLGIPEEDARIAAEILLAADLRGVDSHGIIRLYTYYGNRLAKGLIDPRPEVKVLRETPTTLALDAGTGLGQPVAKRAMQRCIAKARESGMGVVTVRNSNHYGIAGYYAMMALPEDMIGLSLTNAQPLVAPTYGRTAMLGTNPIAVAVPAGSQRPFVLDMATSIVPIGRITVYDKAGKEIPAGWGVDSHGKITTHPAEVLKGGALMALGGSDIMRGYKGYSLALLVDILCGVLAGAAFATQVGHPGVDRPADVGHFFAALRVDAFRDLDEFKRDMDSLLQEMKQAPKAEGQPRIFIAGEKEFELAEYNHREGIPLLDEVVKMLKKSGEEAGVPFDCPPVGEAER
ncbi:MAG TPA: Ldh family oxidoreductase [Anaerolineaceae bacterium]|nr:Ldh family oxidoreductase [Anaerolineaceae bacterium]HPN52321.1 Ldh family oxidoreductase [Anaerolineaceae bacterium]